MKTTAGILCILMLITTTLGGVEEVVRVENLNSRGILFEPIGKARIYKSLTQIITTVPIVDWQPILEFMNQSVAAVETLCKKRSLSEVYVSNSCHNWQHELDNTINQLNQQINQLKSWERTPRQKRALVNLVGRLSNFLFGTMDDSDAENIYSRLETLEQHDGENLQVLKKGIAILKSNAQDLSTALGNLTEHEEALSNRVEQFNALISSDIRQLKESTRGVYVQSEINQVVLFVISKLSQINKYLNDHFSILNALHQHQLHPLVASNFDLVQALKTLEASLANDFWLMSPTTIGQITTVDTMLLPNKIVVQIQLPVPSPEEYTINKIYTLPTTHDKKMFTLLEIQETYLLNNSLASKYLTMEENAFDTQCKVIKSIGEPEHYLCKQTQPIIMTPDSSDCVINLFHNPNRELPACNHRVGKGLTSHLIKMVHSNSWLFILDQERTLTAHCSPDIYSIPLRQTGIFTLKKDCDFQFKNWILPFTRQVKSEVKTHQTTVYEVPPINLNKTTANALQDESNSTVNIKLPLLKKIGRYTSLKEILHLKTKSLDELENEVNQIELKRQLERTSKHQTIQMYTGIPIATLILIIIGARIILKLRQRYCNKAKTTNPLIVNFQQTPSIVETEPSNSRCKISKVDEKENEHPKGKPTQRPADQQPIVPETVPTPIVIK